MRGHRRPILESVYITVFWLAVVTALWLPSFGGFTIACRPWRFTELTFGFAGYYRVRYSRDGNYLEGFDHQGLVIGIVASLVVTVFCAWQWSGSLPEGRLRGRRIGKK